MKSELGERLTWLANNAPLANALERAAWMSPQTVRQLASIAHNYKRACRNWQVRAR